MSDTNIPRGLDGCSVNFVSWNVKSLNHPVKRKKVFTHLKQLNIDIAFLQETHLRTIDHSRLKGGWAGQMYHSNFHSKARGTAILIDKNTPFTMTSVEADPAGRFIIVVGQLYAFPVILANVYAPNWDNPMFFSNFFSRLPNMTSHHLILGGDMNCALSPVLDRSSPKKTSLSKSAKSIRLFLKSYGVADVWRFRNPTSREYSFFSPVHKTYSRIDNFFLDKRLLPLITKCDYRAIVISDHGPLTMRMRIPNTQSSCRIWRLNPLLLSEEAFTNFIASEITLFLKINRTPGMSSLIIWESLKAYLRGQVISYCANQKKISTVRLKELADEILELDRLHSYLPSADIMKKRMSLQVEFDLLSTRQAEYLISKSRHGCYEHGEKAGRILAHQLRQRTANQTIPVIKDEQGLKITDSLKINSRFQTFYQSLYTSDSPVDPSVLEDFFGTLRVPCVDPGMAAGLEEDLSVAEIASAIGSMQSGKSPGPDGYPADFFKKFSNQLSPLLLSVFEESLSSGSLPPTMRQAVISLILKKDRDSLECSSFRPISLLCTDVKILAKVMARRLEAVIPSIVSPDQTGFIKNRYSFFNIRRLLNILYGPSPPGIPEVVLSLDAEKAFDRVEWGYLFSTLVRFGFGPKFISWIRMLYTSPMAAVRTNNNLSTYFELQRGTRQGCPLSPLLFAVAMEPLALALRQNADIKGIQRAGLEYKVSLYADDMLLYISQPLSSLPKLIALLADFGKISGYKVNVQKSELMPVGVGASQVPLGLFPFKISPKKFKYLGIWVTHNHKDLYAANYQPLLSNLKQDIERWDLLPLSLGGRINTIKMNVLPKFLYIFQCLPIFLTKSFFSKLNNQISTFIWNKKPPRIKRSTLQRPRISGGMALPNFMYYYWAANIRSLLYWVRSDAAVPKWTILEGASIESTSLAALLCVRLPFTQPISSFTSNPVIIHSIKIWNQFRRSFSLGGLSQAAPITKNHMFLPSVMDGAFDSWSRGGVVLLSDLYIDNIFASFEQLVQKYDIPRSHFYKYLQLRNFVISNSDCFPSCPPMSLLDSIFNCKSVTKQAISIIYVLLNTHDLTPLDILKNKWETDLDEPISEEIWHKVIQGIFSSSICLRHAVVQFKVVHRLHWSKDRLSKINVDIDPICDRCRQAPATLLHMFWTCPKLHMFWKTIFEIFSKIFGKAVEPTPFIALFGVPPEDTSFRWWEASMLAFCSFLARRLILFKWKDPIPPTYSHWIKEVMYHIKLEKIRYTVRGSTRKFFTIWQPFLTFFEDMESDSMIM